MIVRERPSGVRLFFSMRGSVLPRIWKSLAITTLLAVGVTATQGTLLHHKITLTTIPFTLIGLPLAIFLGFRNTSAYDRFWEGRKIWGDVVLRSRNLARQCLSLIRSASGAASNDMRDIRVQMIYRTIAYAHALRLRLRESAEVSDMLPLLSADEIAKMQKSSNRPLFLMDRMGEDLRTCIDNGQLDACLAVSIDASLSALVGAAAACERIKNTPVPFPYTLLLHRTACLYCFLLPFGLVDTLGYMTPFVVLIVAYTFFGLDALGDEIEEPFGLSVNHLPLDTICRSIEINLRESLGEIDIPSALVPVNYRLQ